MASVRLNPAPAEPNELPTLKRSFLISVALLSLASALLYWTVPGKRTDIPAAECTTDQLKYKSEAEAA